jgi:hypothetical protein
MLGVSSAPFAKLVARPGPSSRSITVTFVPAATQKIGGGYADRSATDENHFHRLTLPPDTRGDSQPVLPENAADLCIGQIVSGQAFGDRAYGFRLDHP